MALWGSLARRGPRAVPVRRGGDRLALLPAGRAQPGGHAVAPRALEARAREAGRHGEEARRAGASRSSTWRARSSPPTSSSPTSGRGWPTCPPRSGRASWRACSAGSPATCRSTGATAGDFLRTFFRRYEGADVARARRASSSGHVGEFMLQKASPAAIRRVREHRAAGHRTILDHGGGRAVHPGAGAAVRRRDRRRARGPRRALHRVHVGAAARRRGARGVAPPLRRRPRAST